MSTSASTYYHLSFEPAVRRALRPLQIIRVTEDTQAPRRAVRLIRAAARSPSEWTALAAAISPPTLRQP